MSGKRSALHCELCGRPRRFDGDMSFIGLCEFCSHDELVNNLLGLADPFSVEYKRWKIAYEVSFRGRPRNTTPSREQVAQIVALREKLLNKGA